MTRLSVCGLGVSCNEMNDTPMLLVVILKCILFYKCSTFFRILVQMHRPIFFKLKFYLTSPVPQSHYCCNTFIMKGCNRFKILLRFQIFCIKSNENMVWACHLPKRWECPTIFGRKFLEIYVVRCQNMPPKFVSTRFRVRLHFVNEKVNKIF